MGSSCHADTCLTPSIGEYLLFSSPNSLLTLHIATCSKNWRLSSVLLKLQSVYQTASIMLPWRVAVTLPPSSARRFVGLPVLRLILVRYYVPTTVGIANSPFMGSSCHADTCPTPSLGECFLCSSPNTLLTLHVATCSKHWRLSSVLLKLQSVYQTASIGLPWPVAEILPPSSARRFVGLPVLGLILVRCYVPTTVGFANSQFMGSSCHADTCPTPSLGECLLCSSPNTLLTLHIATCSKIWRLSSVLLKLQSVYQTANIAPPWPVAVTLPPSSARRFVGAWLHAVLANALLGAMSVRRSRKTRRLGTLAPWSARTTSTIHASGYSNADTHAAFLVPPIIHATPGVDKLVDNAVDIVNAVSHAGNLVHRV